MTQHPETPAGSRAAQADQQPLPTRTQLLDHELLQAAQALKERDLWRTPLTLLAGCAPTAQLSQEAPLLFCSNNYLGLANDPRLIAAACAAAQQWGTGSGASRLVSGTFDLHRQLERALATLKGTADCVLFSSGYLANLGTITALCGKGDAVVSDALNHASIIDGCRLSGAMTLVYPHGQLDQCKERILQAKRAGARRVLIVTDSVFSMDGDLCDLPRLCDLADELGAVLMVDEAHATGVLGEGRGATHALGQSGRVDVIMGTCSKALASLGGFVAGSQVLCDFLRNRARSFVFDTAPAPSVVAATLAAISIVTSEPERATRVCQLASHLARSLRELGYDVPMPAAAIVPVMIGDSGKALALSAALRQKGVLALAIRPPTVPVDTARIRLCPMATHTDAQLDAVIAAFADCRHLL